MHFLSSAPVGSAWTFGASILTFAFPMILFIAVGTGLWVLYTKPELVPGRPVGDIERPVSATPLPGQPAAAQAAAPENRPAAATADGAAVTPAEDSDAAATEDGG